ncbi:MAG: hypothetical protein PHY31_10070, partial [Smithellaceae bacterium]|nr:hypothetical protein [Smithellaceae bacterium]
RERSWLTPDVWIGPALLTAVLLAELIWLLAKAGGPHLSAQTVGAGTVGATLMGPYILGVEMASIILLAGLIGSYHLARGLKTKDGKREGADR